MEYLSAYLKEREGVESIVTDKGFASYLISGEECYIKDIYVIPDFRKCGLATALADQITEIAKKRGCTYLTGTVMPSAMGSTSSLKVLIAYGFRLHSAVPNGIFFRKDI